RAQVDGRGEQDEDACPRVDDEEPPVPLAGDCATEGGMRADHDHQGQGECSEDTPLPRPHLSDGGHRAFSIRRGREWKPTRASPLAPAAGILPEHAYRSVIDSSRLSRDALRTEAGSSSTAPSSAAISSESTTSASSSRSRASPWLYASTDAWRTTGRRPRASWTRMSPWNPATGATRSVMTPSDGRKVAIPSSSVVQPGGEDSAPGIGGGAGGTSGGADTPSRPRGGIAL